MATRVTRGLVNFDLTATNDPLTTSVNVGTGSNRGLMMFVFWRNNNGHVFASDAATYNGVTMTQIVAPMETGTQYRFQMWAMDAPTTGTNTLSLTPNSGTALSTELCTVGYVAIEDVDMSTFLSSLSTLRVSGSNNTFPLTETTVSETVPSDTGDYIYMVSVQRLGGTDIGGGRLASLGDVLTSIEQLNTTNGLRTAHADGAGLTPTSSPSITWSSTTATSAVERHVVISIPSLAAPPAPPTDGSPLRLGIGIGGSPLILNTQGNGSPLIIR